jgi:uncharacterized protein YjbI with pentapeptide repeats
MTVRDWLELLIVPLALAVIGFSFTVQQNARQQRIEDARTQAQQELERQHTQNTTLQAYLSQMTNLLLERNLRESEEGSEVRKLAQARTLAVLRAINTGRKTEVMSFLVDVGLVQRIEGRDPLIELDGTDLGGVKLGDPSPTVVDVKADLSGADLGLADLRKAYLLNVNLADANLSGANLSGADLRFATLSDATLHEVDLSGANLTGAHLSGADLDPPGSRANLAEAILVGADLKDANLQQAILSDANLQQATLSDANLSGAILRRAKLSGVTLKGAVLDEANLSDAVGVTKEELEQKAGSLEGAIMPDGSKHD